MKVLLPMIAFAVVAIPAAAQSSKPAQSSTQSPSAAASTPATSSQGIETEKVKIPDNLQTPPVEFESQPGYMVPAQTREMLTKLWQSEARIKDLLTQIHPANWKASSASEKAVESNIGFVRQKLDELEKSRTAFDGRVDSEYLGFETYAAISHVLPPLSTLAISASRYQELSISGELDQAWNELVTMQQAMEPYLSFLLRNHDRTFLVMESNLAGCQDRLAFRHSGEPAVRMKNVPPNFRGRRRAPKKAETSKSDK